MKSLIFVVFVTFQVSTYAQMNDSVSIAEIAIFQKNLNTHYKDKEHSPLTKKDRRKFKQHDFFEINFDYSVMARIELTPKSDTFGMQTSTDRRPLYRKYAVAYFTILGTECQLNIYQNIKYSQKKGHENSLFLLFNDLTNGTETYGGGRYIDLEKPSGNELKINFNLAYNPYCHYNSRYSCPIPPPENNLKVAIKAGVKKYEGANSH